MAKDEAQIEDHVVSYYKDLYKRGTDLENNLIEDTIPKYVTTQQNTALCLVPNEEEIRYVIFSMNSSITLGLDDLVEDSTMLVGILLDMTL